MYRKPHLSDIIPQGLLQREKQLAVKVIADAQPGVSIACQSGANEWGQETCCGTYGTVHDPWGPWDHPFMFTDRFCFC
jgi:hypothetical protein